MEELWDWCKYGNMNLNKKVESEAFIDLVRIECTQAKYKSLFEIFAALFVAVV